MRAPQKAVTKNGCSGKARRSFPRGKIRKIIGKKLPSMVNHRPPFPSRKQAGGEGTAREKKSLKKGGWEGSRRRKRECSEERPGRSWARFSVFKEKRGGGVTTNYSRPGERKERKRGYGRKMGLRFPRLEERNSSPWREKKKKDLLKRQVCPVTRRQVELLVFFGDKRKPLPPDGEERMRDFRCKRSPHRLRLDNRPVGSNKHTAL